MYKFLIIKPTLKTGLATAVIITLSGCVSANNYCGNEQRDWNSLDFPKDRYCSVPDFLPFADHYEAANKAVCKVHDNNSGKYSNLSRVEADRRFLCDYMKHSTLPVGVRHVTGYMSYAALRISAPDEPEIGNNGSPVGEERSPQR